MATTESKSPGSRSLKQFAYDTMYRPGIDLAVVVAMICSAVDFVSMFFPWLVGMNSTYVSGKGLTYTVAVKLSAFEMFSDTPYLAFLLLSPILTIILVYVSVRPEGIVPPRLSYKTKSGVLILLAGLSSLLPTMTFLNRFAFEAYLSRPDIFVGRWELGGGATVPMYAGLGFMLALGLKIIKD